MNVLVKIVYTRGKVLGQYVTLVNLDKESTMIKKPMVIVLLWYRSWGDHILGRNILVFEQHDNVGRSLNVNTTTMYIIGNGYKLEIKTLFHG